MVEDGWGQPSGASSLPVWIKLTLLIYCYFRSARHSPIASHGDIVYDELISSEAIDFRNKYIYSTKKIQWNCENLWSYRGMPTFPIILCERIYQASDCLASGWCRGTELCEAEIVRHKKYDRSIILGVRDRSVTNYSRQIGRASCRERVF